MTPWVFLIWAVTIAFSILLVTAAGLVAYALYLGAKESLTKDPDS